MRSMFSNNHLAPEAYLTPSVMGTVSLSTSAAEAIDYPSGTKFMLFHSDARCIVNLTSTSAAIPSTSVAPTTDTTKHNQMVPAGHESAYEIQSDSTGFSVIGLSTGILTISFYGQ